MKNPYNYLTASLIKISSIDEKNYKLNGVDFIKNM